MPISCDYGTVHADAMTSWRQEIAAARSTLNDIEGPVVAWVSTSARGVGSPDGQDWYEQPFFKGYGDTEDTPPFRLWTPDYVYFAVSYDGYKSVSAVPRRPRLNIAPDYVGGY